MSLEEKLEIINKDRYVDSEFVKKLEEIGLHPVVSGLHNDAYIRIGEININISSDRKGGSTISETKKRTKAEACRLIEEALEEQYRAAQEDDAYVESFFQGHLLNNALGLKEEGLG